MRFAFGFVVGNDMGCVEQFFVTKSAKMHSVQIARRQTLDSDEDVGLKGAVGLSC
jgi:hypothetical protein